MRNFDANYEDIEVGDKFVYIGEPRDDEDLYAWMEDNTFVHFISELEEESELVWTEDCPYSIQMGLILVDKD